MYGYFCLQNTDSTTTDLTTNNMITLFTSAPTSKLLSILLRFVFVQNNFSLKDEHSSFVQSQIAQNHRNKKCINWEELNTQISKNHFRWMFRITRPCFSLLCQKIIAAVGQTAFRSELYIRTFLDQPYAHFSCQLSIHNSHKETSGGYVW